MASPYRTIGTRPFAGSIQRFRVSQPLATHWREASCREVDCPHHVLGWQTVVPHDSPQAEYVRRRSGRRFQETREGDMSRFVFEAGQACFRDHRVPVGRPPVFTHEEAGERRVMDPDPWLELFTQRAAVSFLRKGRP